MAIGNYGIICINYRDGQTYKQPHLMYMTKKEATKTAREFNTGNLGMFGDWKVIKLCEPCKVFGGMRL